MRVWLITGGSGFVGRHVLRMVGRERVKVVALGRKCPDDWDPGRFVVGDFDIPDSITRALRDVQPDIVIHAAGRTPPADPELLYRANTLGTIRLLDGLRTLQKPCRVVIAGSAAELGPVEIDALPVNEDHPSRPNEPYGLSKWLATCAGLAARPPLEVVSARIFNAIGPGQPLNQAFGRFAARLAGVDAFPLIVGDLDGRRDFVDVRDVAHALIRLAELGRAGTLYHIGTGVSHRVGDGLDHLLRRAGRSIEVRIDPRLISGSGPKDSRADSRRLQEHTGWRPEISWEQSLDDLWFEAASRGRLPLTV